MVDRAHGRVSPRRGGHVHGQGGGQRDADRRPVDGAGAGEEDGADGGRGAESCFGDGGEVTVAGAGEEQGVMVEGEGRGVGQGQHVEGVRGEEVHWRR